MLDTGSDITLLKLNSLKSYTGLDKNDVCKITGVTACETFSLGTISTKIWFDNKFLIQKVHIVEENFPIEQNGILGRDFLESNLCKIDYESFILSIYVNDNEIEIPIQTSVKSSVIKIPPRCETLHATNIKLTEDSVILNEEIQEGVFIANSLISSKGIGHICLLNTTDKEVVIKSLRPKTIPLQNFKIYKIKSSSKIFHTDDERYTLLLKKLNLSNLDIDIDAKNSILDICRQFSDIFHLEGDNLTVNNFYKEKLVPIDQNPIYIKYYRLPQVHIDEIQNQVKDLITKDIIEPSISPYNSPLLIVPKKIL